MSARSSTVFGDESEQGQHLRFFSSRASDGRGVAVCFSSSPPHGEGSWYRLKMRGGGCGRAGARPSWRRFVKGLGSGGWGSDGAGSLLSEESRDGASSRDGGLSENPSNGTCRCRSARLGDGLPSGPTPGPRSTAGGKTPTGASQASPSSPTATRSVSRSRTVLYPKARPDLRPALRTLPTRPPPGRPRHGACRDPRPSARLGRAHPVAEAVDDG
jgi:hypothetical protein